jgi:hypothetical protein
MASPVAYLVQSAGGMRDALLYLSRLGLAILIAWVLVLAGIRAIEGTP